MAVQQSAEYISEVTNSAPASLTLRTLDLKITGGQLQRKWVVNFGDHGHLTEVCSRRDDNDKKSIEWTALDDLAKGAVRLKEGSKRARVRELALKVFSGDLDPPARAKEVLKTYDLRSTLVHTGNIRPEALSFALRIVMETVKRAIAARIDRAVVDGPQSAT